MDIYKEILELEKNNQSFVIATVVKTSGSAPGKPGFKMIIKTHGSTIGTVGGGAIEVEVIKEAVKRFSTGESGTNEYLLSDNDSLENSNATVVPMKCSGQATIYYEVHGSLTTVYVFGGGHVGHALLYSLAPLNYHTILIDNRKEFTSPEKNPSAEEYIYKEYSDFADQFTPPPKSFAVILTHGHKYDYEILKKIYQRKLDFKYVGVIASKSKASAMIHELKEQLSNDIDLSNLHTPIGLKIGGNTAEEIALSIAAEIQAVKYS
ncbi:MAG: XdhC/CoxI family protein [Ignavibacteriaceae bacterium]